MTDLEKLILKFIKGNSTLSYLMLPYKNMVSNKVLPGVSFMALKRIVDKKNVFEFEKSLILYFKKYNIKYLTKKEYLASERQKVFRLKNKDKLKQLNFYLDIDTYKKLQDIKGSKTYNEVIQELLAK